MTQNYEFLGIANESQFGTDRVLISTNLFHFSKSIEPQESEIVITKKSVFLLKKGLTYKIIDIRNIECMTISVKSAEFLFYLSDNSEERFSSLKDKSVILRMLFYLKTTIGNSVSKDFEDEQTVTRFKVYLVPDLSLDVFTSGWSGRSTQLSGGSFKPDEKYSEYLNYKEYTELENKYKELKEAKRNSIRILFSKSKNNKINIDDFELLRTLGRGSYGKVLLCRRRNSKGDLFALKVIKKQQIIDTNHLEHTIAERMIMSCLNHPFLVSMSHAFQSDRKIYFVMEFMKGGELFQHLRRVGRFKEDQVKFLTACIVMALGHLHNKDYIYRDLKPENVMLDEKGYAKLTDFGLAKSISVDGLARTFCGTPEYIAPEIILDKGCNREADWWGLGVLVYELMFGRPPFYSEDTQEMYKKTLLEKLKFPAKVCISAEVKDFITGLLVKSPSRRLGAVADSLEIMNHAWFKDFNWGRLLDKTLVPPYKAEGGDWEGNFDASAINEKAFDSICVVDLEAIRKFETQFKVFDFNNEENELDQKMEIELHVEGSFVSEEKKKTEVGE